MLTPSTINPGTRVKNSVKRVGRGNASGKGTYSARGGKGQTARSGGKGGLLKHAFKAYLQKVPKLRGFKSLEKKMTTVTLATLERVSTEGVEVTPHYLARHSAVRNPAYGVKIVGTGTLTKKLIIRGCVASKAAAQAIEKVGGKLEY
jgi:large subunit ribosomal protein L15